jgi:TRAP-type C4-dicarboxylate transport system substrate-binding protein
MLKLDQVGCARGTDLLDAENDAKGIHGEDFMTPNKFAIAALGSALLLPIATAQAQVTLNVNTWVPPSHHMVSEVMMGFCKDAEAATKGRVKCNLLPKAVVGPPQTFDAVRDGLADISFIVPGYTPGRFALTDSIEFPFQGETSEATSVAYQRIHDKMLAKYDEHKGVKILAVMTHGPGQIFNTKRPVSSLKDLQGMKIRVGGGMVNDVAKVLGTVPMLKPAPESYELLSQGVADGVFFPKEAPVAFKLVPLIKHATYIPGGLFCTSFTVIMNEAAWKKISPADQAELNKLVGEPLARIGGKAWDRADARGEKAVRDANIPIVTADAKFIAEIKERTGGLQQAWIDKVKAKGVDGAAVLKALADEIAAAKR